MKPQCPWPEALHAYSFQADKRINLRQLEHELRVVASQSKSWNLAHQFEDRDGEIIGFLWVDYGDDFRFIDSLEQAVRDWQFDVVKEMIDFHKCDPNFGLDPFWRRYNEVQEKVSRNPGIELSSDELNILVQGLVLKSQFPPLED